MSEVAQLAERCEKATGPDRELDVLIAQSVGFSVNGVTVDKLLSYSPHNTIEQIAIWASGDPTPFFVLRYTASLDAAMLLVPEGWNLTLTVWPNEASAGLEDDRVHPVRLPGVAADAITPALALCAAALRARASLTESPNHE